MWQAMARHGLQRFQSATGAAVRRGKVEQALSELCLRIARETGNTKLGGLERARAFRSKPAAGGKSHYECLNQLIHYWYCCVAASHLLKLGFTGVKMRPTGHDNATDLGDDESVGGPYDIEATHASFGKFVAEVFCVSEALWPQKMAKTRTKLKQSKAKVRAVFYNAEAKPKYRPKMKSLVVFGVVAPSAEVVEIASSGGPWKKLIKGYL